MKFIGREKELRELETEFARKQSFVILYGRRRIGKTTLIREFIRDKPALYFFATQETDTQSRKNFADAVSDFTGQDYLKRTSFTHWEDIFQIFASYQPEVKKILVIDEFQNLAAANSAFASIFQKIWDTILAGQNIMVILCGSYIRMMTDLTLSASSPLYGRRTSQILLKPLSFMDIRNYFTEKSFEETAEIFAVTSGVPKYLEFFDNEKSVFENIEESIINPHGYLYDEPIFLLGNEITEPAGYFSLLKSVAAGNRKLADLASVMEKRANTLSPYLKVLEDMQYLRRLVPATELHPEKSRKGIYVIADSFIFFWFLFVYPNRSLIEMGNISAVMEKIRAEFVPRFMGFVYEDICREIFVRLCIEGNIPFQPVRVGYYADKSTEIDICAVDAAGKIFAGECKFRTSTPVDIRVLSELKMKCRRSFAEKKVVYGLFSNTRFDEMLLSSVDDDVFLIEKTNVI